MDRFLIDSEVSSYLGESSIGQRPGYVKVSILKCDINARGSDKILPAESLADIVNVLADLLFDTNLKAPRVHCGGSP